MGRRLILFLLGLLSAACGARTPEETAERLDDAVARVVEKHDGVRHAVLHVDAPDLGLSQTWVHGVANGQGAAMTTDTQFLSASVGKLFTAAAVLSLVAEGLLELDDPVVDWVAPERLTGLPRMGGTLTLGDLLAHRSGLPDYFDGETADGTPTVFEQWVASPEMPWTRQGMLDHTRRHQVPTDVPFTYADTNYTLLGFVIEGVTGAASFQDVVMERVIAPAGLEATWYHHPLVGEPLEPQWAQSWAGDVELAHAACLSGDQAGGGLVTTAPDLARFLRWLASGDDVSFADLSEGTLTEDALGRGLDYGLGLWRIRPGRVFFALGGLPTLVGASGATGSFAYYIDEYDAVVTGTFDQTDWQERHIRFLLSDVLPALARTAPEDG
ncbi:MAG: serine hydrolase domain-containing protein [Myxococcota bacterium]